MPNKSATEQWVINFREFLQDSYGSIKGWNIFQKSMRGIKLDTTKHLLLHHLLVEDMD
jgi:hypothetical protein